MTRTSFAYPPSQRARSQQAPGLAHLLRLHCQHHAVRVRRPLADCLFSLNPVFALKPRAGRTVDFDRLDRAGLPALVQQAAYQGARHVAAADEGDIHG